jgi:16S rRNA (guanine(1405)-N(7))-methyltransferase
MSNDKLVKKIATSKKYKGVYLKTIARIVKDCSEKYPEKQVEKKAKNLLHQAWGAYFDNRPNFKKILDSFDGKTKQAILPLLSLQSSTKERIPTLNDFYKDIFKVTGKPKTIVDLGSGLNPLTFLWMDLAKDAKYFAFDIDKNQAEFLKSIFKILNINQVKIGLGDILVDEFPKADVAFFFKVLPLLEHQQKGSSLPVLQKQDSKFLVVSFPTKSISGKQKGMIDFYSKQFQDLIRNQPWQSKKLLFENELVFIIKK